MKTPITPAPGLVLLAACLGLGCGAAQAQSAARPQPVCIDQSGPFTYLVRVSNPSRQPGEVQLLSGKKLLFQHSSRGVVFGSRLNVEQLSDGQYTFLVKVGKQVYNYTLDIRSHHERVARLGSVTTALATTR